MTIPGKTNQWQRHIAQSPREFKTNSDQSAPDSSNLLKRMVMKFIYKSLYHYNDDDDEEEEEEDEEDEEED